MTERCVAKDNAEGPAPKRRLLLPESMAFRAKWGLSANLMLARGSQSG